MAFLPALYVAAIVAAVAVVRWAFFSDRRPPGTKAMPGPRGTLIKLHSHNNDMLIL